MFSLQRLDSCQWELLGMGFHILQDILISISQCEPVFQDLQKRVCVSVW